MAKEKLVVIKEANITNNCPECFNQDMKLTFYQKHKYGRFVERTTSEVTNQIKCNKCSSIIYPISWTKDIERIFEYNEKMVSPEKASVKFTQFTYILVFVLIALAGIAVFLYFEGIIQF